MITDVEDEPLPISSDYTWPLVLFAIVAIILVVGASIALRHSDPPVAGKYVVGDDCKVLTCPAGPQGPASEVPGPPGRDGKDGMCIANPACGQGPEGKEGRPGKDGKDGKDGLRGEPGKDAEPCVPCVNGTNGINGMDGRDGTNGTDGANGICDCFNITDISFPNLNVTQSFELQNAVMTCTNATIDSGCLTVGNCPDFSPCNLKGASLELKGGMTPFTYLVVGQANEAGTYVLLGNRITPNYILEQIRTYASTLILEGRLTTELRSLLGALRVEANNGNLILQSTTGQVQMTSSAQTTIDSGTSMSVNMNGGPGFSYTVQSTGSASLRATQTNSIVADDLRLVKGATAFGRANWLTTTSTSTLNCAVVPAAVSAARQSMKVWEDVAMQEDAAIISTNADGYQKIGPNIDVCAGGIRSAAAITMTAPSVNILGTTFLAGGIINANQVNGGAGSCCTSDKRVKQDIKPLDVWDSLARVMRLEPLEYRFTEAYQAVDHWVGNHVHRGFLAQHVEEDFPRAIRRIERDVAGKTIHDFRQMIRDALIPDMVAAMQAQQHQIELLMKEVEALKKELRK